jgi:Uma2 family endonuclease
MGRMSRPRIPPTVETPMAPSLAAWAAMSEAQRQAVLATLEPMPQHEAMPPESDAHIDAWMDAADALGNWFRAKRRRAYIGRGITVYYPERVRFAPDLFVVLDAEPGPRRTWVVNREGRTLDFALEVHAHGDKKKDTDRNVTRYAELGIPEYVIYDAERRTITGYRLAPGARSYTPVLSQLGRWQSAVLGLSLGVRDGRLRFFDELHVIPFERERHEELEKALREIERRAEAEAERAAAEAERAAAEAERAAAEAERAAAEAERAAAEARRADAAEAEIARLRALLSASQS